MEDCLLDKGDEGNDVAHYLYVKTNGNPFYIKELLKNLRNNGAIQLDLKNRKWICDHIKLREMQISTDVVDYLLNSIRELDKSEKKVLNLASFFGHTFDLSSLVDLLPKELEKKLGHVLRT